MTKINIQSTPNPGSNAAIDLGCQCATLDNGRGIGAYGGAKGADGNPIFWINSDCPLHGKAVDLCAEGGEEDRP